MSEIEINPRRDYHGLSRVEPPEFDHPLPIQLPLTFVELGYVTATPGAMGTLDQAGDNVERLLDGFRHGNWGITLDEADVAANNRALESGDRLMGVYKSGEHTVWIICVPYDHTTIMLPGDH